ncbi:hypothetical protein CL653_00180 [bacterium]|nr:hypothetical protein [bacterium]
MTGDIQFEEQNYYNSKPKHKRDENGSLAGWLVSIGVASNKNQASLVMMVISLACTLFIGWSWFGGNDPETEPPFDGGSNPEYRV